MRLAAGWIIIKEKKILLIKRSNYTKSFPGFWTIPSGRQEGNESAEKLAIREVKEETWLDFEPVTLFHESVVENSWSNVLAKRFLWNFSWVIKIQEEEADWYAWYTYDEAMKLDLAFDYADVLKKLHKQNYF